LERAFQPDDQVQEEESRPDEPVLEKAAQADGPVHEEEHAGRCIINRDTLVHIQTIIRFVDGFRVSLNDIKGLISKMRQHPFDICEIFNYPCSRSP
jgi:hypothetical protein